MFNLYLHINIFLHARACVRACMWIEWLAIFSYFRKIVYNDLVAITPEQYFKQITKRVAEIKAVSVCIMKESLIRDQINCVITYVKSGQSNYLKGNI